MPVREMLARVKKEKLDPKDFVNDDESKKILHRHILKSISTTKKTVQSEDIVK